jgi:hypothetical protein
MFRSRQMMFSKTLLLVITPVGVIIGLHEAWRLAGGLVVLVAAQVLLLALAGVALVRRIREEER